MRPYLDGALNRGRPFCAEIGLKQYNNRKILPRLQKIDTHVAYTMEIIILMFYKCPHYQRRVFVYLEIALVCSVSKRMRDISYKGTTVATLWCKK